MAPEIINAIRERSERGVYRKGNRDDLKLLLDDLEELEKTSKKDLTPSN